MILLVDIDTIKEQSLIHDNVENDVIRVALERCQDMYIQPVLGSSLYKRLLAGVEAGDLTANEDILIEDYILKVLAISVEIKVIDMLSKQIRNTGYATTTGENFKVEEINSIERGKDMSWKDLTFYKKMLKNYLDENRLLFPLYDVFDNYGVDKEGNTNSYSQNFAVSFGGRRNRNRRNCDDPNCGKFNY